MRPVERDYILGNLPNFARVDKNTIMDWLNTILQLPEDVYALLLIAVICAVGISMGRLKIRGVGLGVTFVFFMGILAGHCGLKINPVILQYAMNTGLVLFVYTLGLQVGPGFVSAFRRGGATLNMLALGVVVAGTLLAVACSWFTPVSLTDMMGVLCGATTNTPALGTAQQALTQVGMDDEAASMSLGCAVTYPLGVVGVILAYMVLRFTSIGKKSSSQSTPEEQENEPFIVSFHVKNPAVVGKTLKEVAALTGNEFVVSRLWRENKVSLPDATTILKANDRILVITKKKDLERLTIFFGERDSDDWNKDSIDWNKLDRNLISKRIVITKRNINGKRLGALQLRNRFQVNVSRVKRAGMELVATPDLVLRIGDRLTVIGEEKSVEHVGNLLGNVVKNLDEPNLVAIFIGIIVGVALGSVPVMLPSMSVPVKLGLAGGPIIIGILVGAYGPRFHMLTYTTSSVNLMLRAIGLSVFLACLGLQAGPRFFDTVIRQDGALWVALGFTITVVPVVVCGWLILRFCRLDLPTVGGMLCGAMANPMALDYVNDTSPTDKASVAYTTVYPLCMFARVILVQIILVMMM